MRAAATARPAVATAYDLAGNELPYGPLPGVRAAVEAQISALARYPDPFAARLCASIAAAVGVPATMIFAGHGSSDALTTVLRSAARPDATVVYAAPGFTGYDALIAAAGLKSAPVAGGPGGWQPLGAMLSAIRADTAAVIVTTPHNPSGEVVRAAPLAAFLRAVPASTLVVLDEAYLDFDEGYEADGILALIFEFPNFVVTRSFSKAHGLAALRVGYAIGHLKLMRRLRRRLVAYSVGTAGAAAAIASLSHPRELAARVSEVRSARADLVAVGRQHGYSVPDSFGNFIWLPDRRPERLVAAFAAEGIAVQKFPGAGVRITATTVAAVAAVSEALARFAAVRRPE
ncbi:pyridoxal phosphate-dependent aminotransferase [Nocardia goodfellowii]|uniref:Aminotransferase n=1 Tax=Nocardia goodfellowii TaxID=882446 RepID=A0ABS4QKG1_9NOCA|nr:aminotransferase class I/II-fold pyridoxal phosphate-dependent enzyme [Nocardia goodfellowii]MBP2191529.1 histidinol-phosphate aminotransferase [Nocardia goodfellowii]